MKTTKVLIENRKKMNFPNGSRHRRYLVAFAALMTLVFCLSVATSAQDKQPDYPTDAEPPPFKILSEQEKDNLEGETKIKKRTILALELMDARLLLAESANEKGEYKEVFDQLGRFHAIVDHTLKFLIGKNNDSRKILFNFKRFEIGLRKVLPRIELIRRDVPLRYQYYVKTLLIDIRDARSRAVAPLYDDSVISRGDGS